MYNRIPTEPREVGADISGATICYSIADIFGFEKCFNDIADTIGDDRVKAYRLTISGGGSESSEPMRARYDVILNDAVYIERNDEMESGLQDTFEDTEAQLYAALVWVDDVPKDKQVQDRDDEVY